jgi:signal transduction histidine kinase
MTVGWAVLGGVTALLAAGLGVVIATRAGGAAAVGASLGLVGVTLAYTAAREGFWELLGRHPDTAKSLNWLVALLAESSIWAVAAIALLLLLFPDGRLPSRRWRLLLPAIVATAALHHAFGAVDSAPYEQPLQHLPHAFGPPPRWLEWMTLVGDISLLGMLIASAASLVHRTRHGTALQRRQLKWLSLAGAAVPVFIVVCVAEVVAVGHTTWIAAVIGALAVCGIPVAIAIALLRDDLYDVDRALATAVAYAATTGLLFVLFAAVALGAGLLVGRDSTLTAVAVTALAVLGFGPVRRRLQTRVDRRLYPQRCAALAAIDELIGGIHDGSAQPEQLGERLRVALRDPGLRIGYAPIRGHGLIDEAGVPVEGSRGMPIMSGAVTIGSLHPGSGSASPQLLRELAARVVTLVEIVRLRLELTTALREVEASRSRLVRAGDEARRQLERDLHDGAQQRLVSLGMALRVAQRHVADGTVDMTGMIDQAVAELGTAVAELREIAHGLRPSTLDEGLPAALRTLTRHAPVPVELAVNAGELPDEVATTIYFVASEAITNAIKHGGPTRIDVSVRRANGRVQLRVADDGCGGASTAAGSGLAGLRDRLDALGGRLVLVSDERSGTIVEALVPCAS